VIDGFCASVIVTVNEQVTVFAGIAVSEAEHITVVTPFGNAVPDAGLQMTGRAPSQLSLAESPLKFTTAVHKFGSVLAVRFVQPANTGASSSNTVTVNEQFAIKPTASVTVHPTVVMPFGNTPPDAGVQATAFGGNGQLSFAAGAL